MNEGTTWSVASVVVVVVVGSGSGPVSNSANESFTDSDSEFPTALHRNSDTHDTDTKEFSMVPGLGLETTDQTEPSQERTDVRLPNSS